MADSRRCNLCRGLAPHNCMSRVKIVQGERRTKYRNLFQIFFIPNRILSYSKIVKAEIGKPNLSDFHSGSFPYFLQR